MVCAISKSGDGGKGVDKEGQPDVAPHAHTTGGLHADCQEVRPQGPAQNFFQMNEIHFFIFYLDIFYCKCMEPKNRLIQIFFIYLV